MMMFIICSLYVLMKQTEATVSQGTTQNSFNQIKITISFLNREIISLFFLIHSFPGRNLLFRFWHALSFLLSHSSPTLSQIVVSSERNIIVCLQAHDVRCIRLQVTGNRVSKSILLVAIRVRESIL